MARDPAAAHEGALPLTDRLEAIFAADLPELPSITRELLLLAAAAESAELPVILSAAGDRATPDDWLPAERAGLVRLDADRIRFRHPLIRSAVYQAATYTERHTAHRALADVLVGDPDRRAWHHAAAASGVDEEAAQELEDSAARAQRRGGYAAAATALERAARLSPDPAIRARRLVRAATMAMYAGHPRWVGELSARVATLTDDPAVLAEASLRAGWALAVTTQFAGSLGFLLPVAEAVVDEDPVLALDALSMATTPAYNSGAPEHREKLLRIVERVPPQEDETDRLWVLAGCDPARNRARALGLLAGTWTAPLPKPGSGIDVPLSRMVVSGGAAWILDETTEAIRLLGAAMEHLRRSPTSGANATVAQALALALYESGSWTEARAALDEADGLAAEGGLENVMVGAPVLGATLLALRGDTEAARATVQRAVYGIDLPNCRSLQVRTHYALGAAALAEGDHAAAYDRFRAVYTRQPEPAPCTSTPPTTTWPTSPRPPSASDGPRTRGSSSTRPGGASRGARCHRGSTRSCTGPAPCSPNRTTPNGTSRRRWPTRWGTSGPSNGHRSASTTRSGCAADAARWRRARCSPRRWRSSNGSAPARGPTAHAPNCVPRVSPRRAHPPPPRTRSPNSPRSSCRSPASPPRA